MSRANDLADIESGLLAMRGMDNAIITAGKTLTDSETGFILLDASAGAFNLALPPASRPMDVRVQRVDNGGQRLVVEAVGAEKILFHTHLRPEGYKFFVLMGAGDFWHLRSDGNGNWRVLDRLDSTPLGRPVFETTTAFQPGGWAGHNGLLYNRAEWPWLWDHAQASGMLTTEALRAGKEGMWTSGNGASTFRSPEGRGEFIRMLDEARGVDAARAAGSWQVDLFKSHQHTFTQLLDRSSGAMGNAVDGDENIYGTSTRITDLTGGAETRPRNIAYPGRLKMI